MCALHRLGYKGPIPTYRCHPFQAHGLSACEVRVEIPFDPMAPFRGDAVEKMVHMALTALCKHSLTITADTPLAVFPIRNQEEPVWLQHHKAVCDITSLQFSFQCSHLAKYTRYMFNF
jgi:hypothetical protein